MKDPVSSSVSLIVGFVVVLANVGSAALAQTNTYFDTINPFNGYIPGYRGDKITTQDISQEERDSLWRRHENALNERKSVYAELTTSQSIAAVVATTAVQSIRQIRVVTEVECATHGVVVQPTEAQIAKTAEERAKYGPYPPTPYLPPLCAEPYSDRHFVIIVGAPTTGANYEVFEVAKDVSRRISARRAERDIAESLVRKFMSK